MNSISGIYMIRNSINGNCYIGSAANLKKRKSTHFSDLRRNVHRNGHLQNAYNKYGESQFLFSVIEYCEKDMLVSREQYYIDTMLPQYNIAPVAGNNLGTKRTPETCAKLRLSHIGKTLSPEARAKVSSALIGNKRSLGYKHSPETRAKVSLAGMGRVVSKETREKISAAQRGRKLSKERVEKMREEQRGKKLSQETKDKISASNKGKHNALGYRHTAEAKFKISAARIGKAQSPETKAKISAVKRARNAEKRSNRLTYCDNAVAK